MSEVETSMKGTTALTVEIDGRKLELRKEDFGIGVFDKDSYVIGFTHNEIAKLAIASGLSPFLEVLGWELRHFKISEV
jgi:hypothetical protein